jgi:hypothetical protein
MLCGASPYEPVVPSVRSTPGQLRRPIALRDRDGDQALILKACIKLARSNSACLIDPMRSRKLQIDLRQSRRSCPDASLRAASVSDLSIASSSASCSKTETWVSHTWVALLVFLGCGIIGQRGLLVRFTIAHRNPKFPQHQPEVVTTKGLTGNVRRHGAISEARN